MYSWQSDQNIEGKDHNKKAHEQYLSLMISS